MFRGYPEGGYVRREGILDYGDYFRDRNERGFDIYAPKKELLIAYFDMRRLAMGIRSVVLDYESGSSVFGANAPEQLEEEVTHLVLDYYINPLCYCNNSMFLLHQPPPCYINHLSNCMNPVSMTCPALHFLANTRNRIGRVT